MHSIKTRGKLAVFLFLLFLTIMNHETHINGAADEFEIRNGILLNYYGDAPVVEIPSEVKVIGKEAFAGSSILKVIIPESVTIIDDGAFKDCSSLIHVELPVRLKEIRTSSFEGCISLYDISIPDQVETIGESAFNYCINLKKCKLPQNLKIIGNYAFLDCGNLMDMDLPIGLGSIGDFAFDTCSSLKNIQVPEGVQSIGDYAFADCIYLESISLPSSVKSIGKGFLYGNNLKKIILDDNNLNYKLSLNGSMLLSYDGTYLHTNLLESSDIVNIPATVKTIGDYAFANSSMLTRIQLPKELERIEENAFFSCINLNEIIINENLQTIAPGAFSACYELDKIRVSEKNQWFKNSKDSRMLMSKDESILYAVPSAEGNLVNLSDKIRIIKEKAFYGCTGLISVTLPKNVIQIEKEAFYGCSGLENISISANLNVIDERAFDKCTQLSEVQLPKAINRIHRYAFDFEYLNRMIVTGEEVPEIFGEPDVSIDDSIQESKVYALIPADKKKEYTEFFYQLTKAKLQTVPEGDFLLIPGTFKVVIVSHPGYEYSLDGKEYQQSPVFKSLMPDTSYTIYMRKQSVPKNDRVKKTFKTEPANRFDYDYEEEGNDIYG